MEKRISSYFTVIFLVLLSTIFLWLPFVLGLPQWFGLDFQDQSFLTVYRHFDGLLYIVPAKSWYVPNLIDSLRLEVGLPIEYYAAHLPLYPVFIALFSFMGYLKSMVFVNVLFTCLLAAFLLFLLQKFELTKKPLVLVGVFLFLPRFLVIRSIGAPESLFMLCVLVSLYFFEEKRYWLAGLAGALAVITKTPGILLFVAYIFVFVERFIKEKKIHWNWLGIALIPLGLVAVFLFYAQQYGNFWAYFNTTGVVPMPYPFAAFNFQAKWVGTAWLEDIILYLFLYGLAVMQLKDSKHRSFYYFSVVFLFSLIFVQHRDISRYSLPLWPLACIAFEKLFTSKKFLIIALLLLPAIYLYAWNFLLYNVMPISDWKAFL